MQSLSPCGYRTALIVEVPYLQLGGTARLEVALGRCWLWRRGPLVPQIACDRLIVEGWGSVVRRSRSPRKSSLLDELDGLDRLHEQDLEDSPSSGKLPLGMRRSETSGLPATHLKPGPYRYDVCCRLWSLDDLSCIWPPPFCSCLEIMASSHKTAFPSPAQPTCVRSFSCHDIQRVGFWCDRLAFCLCFSNSTTLRLSPIVKASTT